MRASWSLEIMKAVDATCSKKNKRLEDIKNKLEASNARNAELVFDLQTSQENEKLAKEANSTLISEHAEIHSQYLRFKKSSEDFENELKAERLSYAKDIMKLTEDYIEMFSKGSNKCKYNLFKEYWEKNSGS